MQRLNGPLGKWDINAYDYKGRTAIGVASSEGHLSAVKYLTSHGANPHHRDFRGNNALDDAKRGGYADVIKYLEENGMGIRKISQ